MALARLAQLAIVCATTALFSIENAAADEAQPLPPATASAGSEVSPALIGLTPETKRAQPPPTKRKLWIALGVLSGAAVVGAVVAVGVSLGTSSNNHSVFNDWGTLNVTRH